MKSGLIEVLRLLFRNQQKRGISTIVATVIIVLFSVVGVSILWAGVSSTISSVDFSSYDTRISVVTKQGYTFYDEVENKVTVQVGVEGKDIPDYIQVILTHEDGEESLSTFDAPPANGRTRINFDVVGYPTNPPVSISAAPLYKKNGRIFLGPKSLVVDLPKKSEDSLFYTDVKIPGGDHSTGGDDLSDYTSNGDICSTNPDFDSDGHTDISCGGDDCDDIDPLEFLGQIWYIDFDSDDYSDGTTLTQCERPVNYKAGLELTGAGGDTSGDCDDSDSTTYPGALEVCGDGVDNDCVYDAVADNVCCFDAWSDESPIDVTCDTFYNPYLCSNSIDGDTGTGWFSSTVSDPQNIIFDLGNMRCINKIRVYPWNNIQYADQKTNIEVSNDAVNWVTVASLQNLPFHGAWNEVSFSEVVGRYVRLDFYSTPSYTSVVEYQSEVRNYNP